MGNNDDEDSEIEWTPDFRWVDNEPFVGTLDELRLEIYDSEDDTEPARSLTLNDVEVATPEQAREEAKEIRENAPESRWLDGGPTCDIDELIEMLEEAKAEGIDTVYVNDDGIERSPEPYITNNHRGHTSHRPRPGKLREWVEL